MTPNALSPHECIAGTAFLKCRPAVGRPERIELNCFMGCTGNRPSRSGHGFRAANEAIAPSNPIHHWADL